VVPVASSCQTTKTFSNPQMLWAPPNDQQRPAYLTFTPNSDAVVFQRRWNGDNDYSSWQLTE
jgi:hypothetical protein